MSSVSANITCPPGKDTWNISDSSKVQPFSFSLYTAYEYSLGLLPEEEEDVLAQLVLIEIFARVRSSPYPPSP